MTNSGTWKKISRLGVCVISLALVLFSTGCELLAPAPAPRSPDVYNYTFTTQMVTVTSTSTLTTTYTTTVVVPQATAIPPASSTAPTGTTKTTSVVTQTQTPTATRALTQTSTTPQVGTAQPVGSVKASTATMSRSYAWDFGGRWTWSLDFSQALYDYYKGLPRAPTKDYSIYVTHPLDDAVISSLATSLGEGARKKGYSAFETVNLAVAFVQGLPYTVDSETSPFDEYPRYPIETLVDNGGDCEDTSILLASLLRAMDYSVVLLRLPGHMAVGVLGGDGINGTYWTYQGKKYYYVETTGTGWEIGELPDSYKNASATIWPMVPVPVLTHTWKSSYSGASLNIEVTVENLGSADANGVYVWAGFDAGNDQAWNGKSSPTFDLAVGSSVKVTVPVKVPLDQHTRIWVEIAYGGFSVDESFSDWFDT